MLDHHIELLKVSFFLHIENSQLSGRVLVWFVTVVEDVSLVDLFVEVIEDTIEKYLDVLYVDGRVLEHFRSWCQISISSILASIEEHEENLPQSCLLFQATRYIDSEEEVAKLLESQTMLDLMSGQILRGKPAGDLSIHCLAVVELCSIALFGFYMLDLCSCFLDCCISWSNSVRSECPVPLEFIFTPFRGLYLVIYSHLH